MDDPVIGEIWHKYGLFGVLFYVPLVVFGKVLWKKYVSGDYVSYKDIDDRIKKLELDSSTHSNDDRRQFMDVGDKLEHMMSEIHSYSSTIRDDVKDSRKERADENKILLNLILDMGKRIDGFIVEVLKLTSK